MRHVWVGAMAATVLGCGPMPYETSHAISRGSGGEQHAVECVGTSLGKCHAEARRACPDGYDVVSSDTTNEAAYGQGSYAYATSQRREMIIRCTGSSKPKDLPPPQGALGYRFGMSLPEAEQACRQLGFGWRPYEDEFQCTGLPKGLGLIGFAYLSFCQSELCQIDIIGGLSSSDSAQWLDKLESIQTQLVRKYGRPTDVKTIRPAGCDGRMLECIAQGEARIWETWTWQDGHGLQLHLRSNNGEPAFRLIYGAWERRQSPENLSDL